jgi:hypothetical protein
MKFWLVVCFSFDVRLILSSVDCLLEAALARALTSLAIDQPAREAHHHPHLPILPPVQAIAVLREAKEKDNPLPRLWSTFLYYYLI